MSTRETWILNATVLTQDDSRRVLRANLHLADGRIAAITTRKPARLGKGVKSIDAAGLVVAPGFVQCHLHLCQTLFRNQADDLELLDWLSKRIWPFEAAHTADSLKTSALLGIHELLASGTTCILDMGTVRHTEALFEAARESGIRANIGKCLMDHPERTPRELRDVSTRVALDEARALFEKWNGAAGDRLRASLAPRFVISCTEELLREVARLSRDLGAIIHTHASENRREIEWVKELSGLDNIEYLEKLGLTTDKLVLAHGVWVTEREMRILKKAGTTVTHCPSSNLKLASGIAPVPELRAQGVNVALGADGAPCNNNLNMFQEMRLAALIHKPGGGPRAMRALEVLDMATRDGARALCWDSDIGSIEVGKKADLIALDLNTPENLLPEPATRGAKLDAEAFASSIVYSSQPKHVRWTMVDGQVVSRDGRPTKIALGPLLEKAARAQRRIARDVLT